MAAVGAGILRRWRGLPPPPACLCLRLKARTNHLGGPHLPSGHARPSAPVFKNTKRSQAPRRRLGTVAGAAATKAGAESFVSCTLARPLVLVCNACCLACAVRVGAGTRVFGGVRGEEAGPTAAHDPATPLKSPAAALTSQGTHPFQPSAPARPAALGHTRTKLHQFAAPLTLRSPARSAAARQCRHTRRRPRRPTPWWPAFSRRLTSIAMACLTRCVWGLVGRVAGRRGPARATTDKRSAPLPAPPRAPPAPTRPPQAELQVFVQRVNPGVPFTHDQLAAISDEVRRATLPGRRQGREHRAAPPLAPTPHPFAYAPPQLFPLPRSIGRTSRASTRAPVAALPWPAWPLRTKTAWGTRWPTCTPWA